MDIVVLVEKFGFTTIMVLRLLDQDMIRLQEKVNTVLELNEKENNKKTIK